MPAVTLQCKTCDVEWAQAWSGLCWLCGEPGVAWTPWYGWTCPASPYAVPGGAAGEMTVGRPWSNLPPSPERLLG